LKKESNGYKNPNEPFLTFVVIVLTAIFSAIILFDELAARYDETPVLKGKKSEK